MTGKMTSLPLLLLALLAFEGTHSHQKSKKVKVIKKVFNGKCSKQCKLLNTKLSQQLNEIQGRTVAVNTNVKVWKVEVNETTVGQTQQLRELRSYQGELYSELRAKQNALESNQTQLLRKVQTQLQDLESKLQATLDDQESELQQRLGAISSNHSQQFTQLIEEINALDSRVKQLEMGVKDSNPNLTQPKLRFIEAYGSSSHRVVIEEAGAAVRDGPEGGHFTAVRTDGSLTTGRYYWHLEITWSVGDDSGLNGPQWSGVAAVGLWRDGSDFSGSPGNDGHSWGMWVGYNLNLNQWRYEFYHGGVNIFTSEPVTYDKSSDVTNRLGFLLDTENQTLAVFDINNNIRLLSFSDVNGSKPLVPAVVFGYRYFQRRFRLRTIDPYRLPKTITDPLHSNQ